MFVKSLSVFLSIVLLSATALGLGADHKNGDLPRHDGWLAGTYEAVNLPCRVHGYWINSSDTLFYRGENLVLEEMLEKLNSNKDLKVRVVLHAGKGIARSPWSKDVVESADWSVTIAGKGAITYAQNQITVNVWFSGNISLDELTIPRGVVVESGREIDTYIERRQRDE
jgi:hypothetical protein